MRRIALIAAAASVLLVWTGCGGDEDEAQADAGDGGVVFVGGDGGPAGEIAGTDGPDGTDDGAEVTDDGADGTEPDATEEPGFEYPCEPLTIEACVTACGSAGDRQCLKEWGPCIPPEEFCGNCADDDCDGQINEGCPPDPECDPTPDPECSVPVIDVAELAGGVGSVDAGTLLHLSAANSVGADGAITAWAWSVEAPDGSTSTFQPGADVEEPTFTVDVAGGYLFTLEVVDEKGNESCSPAQIAVTATVYPPADPEVGCADGEREGFLNLDTYTHIAGCSGGWDTPGITPPTVAPTCGLQGGDDGPNADGAGCASADLCASGWHICKGWPDVAKSSPTGCAGATPPDAKPKSLIFACAQSSINGSACAAEGAGVNDVFGCGNLGTGLGPDKGCGPLDRVLASTQPDSCGFNEAEPPHGPWECIGGPGSDLLEGQTVTKKGCPGGSCSYDGYPVGNPDKGGVLCCRD